MKRLSILFACMVLCFGFSAGSAWAIWEGNAGIAAASDFPGKGMYAKSDMFPKNTVVLIENLETGIKVRAVITGSSGVSGLVAVLSPDTAGALNIKSGSVSRVRISIPTVVSEKGATGVNEGENSGASADPDVNPAVAAAGTAGAIPIASIADSSDNPLVPLDASDTAASDSAAPVAAAPAAIATGSALENSPDSTADTALSDGAATADDVATDDVTTSDIATDDSATDDAAATAAVVATTAAVAAAPVAEVDDTSLGAETAPADAFYDEPELVSSDSAPAAEEVLPVETDSVALVPTEPNPPVADSTLDASAASAIVSPAAAPVPVATAPIATVSPVEAAAAMASLTCVNALGKSGYYVQIASYADPVNAKKVVDRYSAKYPIVIEQIPATKGTILKVCVGPVKKDEYGAILERFKSLGFKDAFVRKGQ